MGKKLSQAVELAKSAIRALDVADGMRWLLEQLGELGLDPTVRKKLGRFNFAEDARLIQARIARFFERGAIDAKSTELYFGLDPLTMSQGKGIEFGCGKNPGKYSTYPESIRSDLCKRMFTLIEGEGEEIALGIGYLGLVLKHAFREISTDALLGSASRRRIVFGFHDGDLFELGTVTRAGFKTAREFRPPRATGLAKAKGASKAKGVSKAKTSPKQSATFPWPGKESGRADWLYASGMIAASVEDMEERVSGMRLVVEGLCGMDKFREAERLVNELVKIEGSLIDASQRVQILTCAATVAAGLDKTTAAVEFLRLGKSVAQGMENAFWRKASEETVVGRADRLGLLEPLGATTPDERLRAEVARGLKEAETELQAGRQAACRRKLAKLDALIRRESGDLQSNHRSRLLNLCDKAGDSALFLAIYESVPRKAWEWWSVVGPLWRLGARDEASRWLEKQFSDAEKNRSLSNMGNYHHLMGQMESVARTYWKLGASERFLETLRRIEKAVGAWDLEDTGLDAAVVLTKLGSLQALGGEASTAQATFLRAAKAITGERNASFRKQCWKELAEAYCDLAAWDDAIKCANKIRDPDTKRESLATVYLRAQRWDDLTAILDGVKDAEEASRLADRLSWVFAEDQ